jgi:hypothetical protein
MNTVRNDLNRDSSGASFPPPIGTIFWATRLNHPPAGSRWVRTSAAIPTFVACLGETGAFHAGVTDPGYNRRKMQANVLSTHYYSAYWNRSPEGWGFHIPVLGH